MLDQDYNLKQFMKDQQVRCIDIMKYSDSQLSKLILNVSTGVIGVSVTLFLAKPYLVAECSKRLLIITWLFLSITIVFEAINYYLSRLNNKYLFEDLNSMIRQPDVSVKEYNISVEKSKNSYLEKIINLLNLITLTFFVFGISSFLFFSIILIYYL